MVGYCTRTVCKQIISSYNKIQPEVTSHLARIFPSFQRFEYLEKTARRLHTPREMGLAGCLGHRIWIGIQTIGMKEDGTVGLPFETGVPIKYWNIIIPKTGKLVMLALIVIAERKESKHRA